MHLPVEIGERRHFGDEPVPLVAAAAVDGDEIGKADALARLDEAAAAAAEGRDAGRMDVDLAALHRQEHTRAAPKADDHPMLDPSTLSARCGKSPDWLV